MPEGRARGGAARKTAGGARPARRGAAAREGRPAPRGAEDRYDLLTAALIGAAVGATAMLLVRRPAARKIVRPLSELGLASAGRMALKAGAGALRSHAVRDVGRAAMPMVREAAENLGDYMRTARSAIDEFLADEVRDLKKAIRRGRRRAGL